MTVDPGVGDGASGVESDRTVGRVADGSPYSDARLRVCLSVGIMAAWTVAFGRRELLGVGTAPPAELSAAFLAVVAYLLGTGAKRGGPQ